MRNWLSKRIGERSTAAGIGIIATAGLSYAQGLDWKTSLAQAVLGTVFAAYPSSK